VAAEQQHFQLIIHALVQDGKHDEALSIFAQIQEKIQAMNPETRSGIFKDIISCYTTKGELSMAMKTYAHAKNQGYLL